MSEQQVPQGTVAEVLEWVGQDPARARAALDAECAGANRSSLINQIEPIANRPEANVESSSSSASSTEQEQSATETPEAPAPSEPGTGVATTDQPADEPAAEGTGIVEDDEGREPYPEGNAPGPAPPNIEDIEIDPRDRATWVGPPNARHSDVELPEDRYDLVAVCDPDDDSVNLGPEPNTVDYFQVISLGGAIVIRTDDQATLLDRDQTLALSRDLRQAMANVTY